MSKAVYFIIACFVLITISSCKKKTVVVPVLSNPIDSMSKIMGTRHWHGQYNYEAFNYNHTHVDYFQVDTSLSFTLTMVNDSIILYNAFNTVDSMFYTGTYEFEKSICYYGNKFQGSVSLIYYYSADSAEFKMDGLDSNSLSMWLKLSTP